MSYHVFEPLAHSYFSTSFILAKYVAAVARGEKIALLDVSRPSINCIKSISNYLSIVTQLSPPLFLQSKTESPIALYPILQISIEIPSDEEKEACDDFLHSVKLEPLKPSSEITIPMPGRIDGMMIMLKLENSVVIMHI